MGVTGAINSLDLEHRRAEAARLRMIVEADQ
jgi:hypothetical protein